MHVDASKRCELNLVRLSNIKNYEKICLTNFDLFNFMHFYTRTRRPLSDGTLQRMMLAFFYSNVIRQPERQLGLDVT